MRLVPTHLPMFRRYIARSRVIKKQYRLWTREAAQEILDGDGTGARAPPARSGDVHATQARPGPGMVSIRGFPARYVNSAIENRQKGTQDRRCSAVRRTDGPPSPPSQGGRGPPP